MHRELKPQDGNSGKAMANLVLLSVNDARGKEPISRDLPDCNTRHRLLAIFKIIERSNFYIREQPFVTKANDIWALGCKFYQLAFKVYDYFHTRRKPEIPSLQVSEHTATFTRELVYRTLEINWWKRPAASEVSSLLDRLSKRTTWVIYVDEAAPEMTDSPSSSPNVPSLHPRDPPEATRQTANGFFFK